LEPLSLGGAGSARGRGVRTANGSDGMCRKSRAVPGSGKAAGVRSPGLSHRHAAKRSTRIAPSVRIRRFSANEVGVNQSCRNEGTHPRLQDGPRTLMARRVGYRGALRRPERVGLACQVAELGLLRQWQECANSRHSLAAPRTGHMNRHEARESGLRVKAYVDPSHSLCCPREAIVSRFTQCCVRANIPVA
jgi:hypothetical protein